MALADFGLPATRQRRCVTRAARSAVLHAAGWATGCAIACSLLITTSLTAERSGSLELLKRQHEQRQAQFATDVESIAAQADGLQLTALAEELRLLRRPFDPASGVLDRLPEEVQTPLPEGLTEPERQCRAEARRIRTEYAQDLYRLARQSLNSRHISLAFHLVREVAEHDPDHRLARQLLGYAEHEGRWVTPYEQQMLRKGNVWHPRFGWLPQGHVARYEQGERYFRGRWMSADEEAALRHDFRNAWEIESDHFLLRTNASLEWGVQLSVALEQFHRFFHTEFAPLFNSPQQMAALFESSLTGSRSRPRRHEIHYFQSKQEFVHRLQSKQERVELSNGVYLPQDRVAYSFHNAEEPETTVETLLHEVTHQFLSESQSRSIDVAREANFWIVEGIACYMESFEVDGDGRVHVGNPRHPRIVSACRRLLTENSYRPLAQFAALGMLEFQRPTDEDTFRSYYSQASGLTHFFLHYEDGRYRDALIEHLSQIYSPSPQVRRAPQSLAELTGVPFTVLDREYRSYLNELEPIDSPTP